MSSAMSLDMTNPSRTCVHGLPSAPMSSLTTTTTCPRDNGPTGAEPRSAWLYSVVWSTTTRDCQGGSKRLANAGGVNTLNVRQARPPNIDMNGQRVRRSKEVDMLYSYDERDRSL